MAIQFDDAPQRNVTRKVIIETLLRDTLIFCLSVPFAIFTWKSSASRDAESKLRRDKFSLFDINMTGISMSEYSRRDDARDGPLGWKIPVG